MESAKFKGDDFGWGYNFGLLYQITDKVKIWCLHIAAQFT